MNKADLTAFVAENLDVTKSQAADVVNSVLDGMLEGLRTDGKVQLVGFGTFTAVERAERKARNPQTGEEMTVPAKTVPKFKAGKVMKAMVAGEIE
jgi:DNA-binding protein HU-beta